MANSKNITGIILSGGQSKRMGKDKGMVLLDGRPLVAYSISAFTGLFSDILIGANNKDYQRFGLSVIADEIQGIGPAGGILSCLKASQTHGNLVLSCDMPLITKPVITTVLKQRSEFDAVVPVHDGHPEPLCAYYSKNAIPVFEEMIKKGMYKLRLILEKLNCFYTDIHKSGIDPSAFENVNTPEDVKRIEARLKSRNK